MPDPTGIYCSLILKSFKMEHHTSIWKANFNNGLAMGLIAVVYSLVIYFLDLTFNTYQGYIFYVIQVVMLYIFVKSYRENYNHRYITYGQAVGSGVVISIYSAIISAIFVYILYAVIDPGLVNKQLAFIEETMIKQGLPQASIDAALKIQKKVIQPAILAPISIFGGILWGTILSLIVAIFVRKEGNPLVENIEK
jgi:hypothetical protein